MTQTPAPEAFLLKWRGDVLSVTLRLDTPRKGRAAFRTNIGHARVRRREIIAETERGETPLAKAWTDIPLHEVSPGVFSADIPLDEVGIFSGKELHYVYPNGDEVSNVDIVYLCKDFSGTLTCQKSEVDALQFFAVHEIPEDIVSPERPALQKWINSKKEQHE